MQASLRTTADEWAAGRFWTYMERRHVQGPSTTSLYPTNTEHGEVGGVRDLEDMVCWWGEGKNLFLWFQLRLFRGGVLLGWLTTQKRQVELEPLGACHEG